MIKYKSKNWGLIVMIVALFLFVGLLSYGLYSIYSSDQNYEPSNQSPTLEPLSKTCLMIDDVCRVNMEVADKDQSRIKGLSGRDRMENDQGMLFVFDEPERICMWMRDMKFSLDIVWLDESKKVLKTRTKITPESYPSQFCWDDTKYVIELNSGQLNQLGIEAGQTLKF